MEEKGVELACDRRHTTRWGICAHNAGLRGSACHLPAGYGQTSPSPAGQRSSYAWGVRLPESTLDAPTAHLRFRVGRPGPLEHGDEPEALGTQGHCREVARYHTLAGRGTPPHPTRARGQRQARGRRVGGHLRWAGGTSADVPGSLYSRSHADSVIRGLSSEDSYFSGRSSTRP